MNMVVREGFMEKGTLEPKLKEVRESTTQVLGRSIPAEQPGNGGGSEHLGTRRRPVVWRAQESRERQGQESSGEQAA